MSRVSDRAFGRRHAPDPRDQNFPIRALLPPVPSVRVRRYWNTGGWWGDQGHEPQCVAYAWMHYLEDGPVTQRARPAPCEDPAGVYHAAQLIDEWPGEDYGGTSVRAGAKVLKTLGYIQEYRWATSLDEIVQALLEKGPVVMGTNWYGEMMSPDEAGFINVGGPVVGGHAYKIDGVNTRTKVVRCKNSWGREWGAKGFAYLSFDDLARLLAEDGEGALAVEIAK